MNDLSMLTSVISEDSNQHRPSPVLRRLPCLHPRRKDDSWQTTPPPLSTSQDSGKVGRQTAPVPLRETERGGSEDVGDAILVAEIAETPWSPVTDEESASPDGEGGRRVRQLETAFSEVEVVGERGGEEQAEEDQTDSETSGEGAYKRQVPSDVTAEDTVQLTRSLPRKRGQQVTKGLAEKKGLRIRLPKSVNEEDKEVFVKVDREFVEKIFNRARRKKIFRRKRIWWSSLCLGGRDHPGMNIEKHGDAVLERRTTPRAVGPAEDLSNASYPLSFTHEEELVKMFVNIQSGEEARDVPGARTTLLAEDTSNTPNPTSPVLDEDDMMRMNVPVEDADISQSTPRLSISHSVKIYREDDDHSEQKTSWRNKIKWRSFWLTSDDSGKKIGEPGLDCASRPLVRTSLSPRAQPHDLALSNTPLAAVPWSPENELMKMVLNIEQQKGEQGSGDNASGSQSASPSEGGYKSDSGTSLREHDKQSGKKVKRRSFWSIGNHLEKNIGDDAPCPRTLSPSEDQNNSAHPVVQLPDEEELLKMLVNTKDGGEERKQGVVAVSPYTAKCIPSRATSDPGKIHRESDELSGKKNIVWPLSWPWSSHLRRMKFGRRLFRLVGGSQSVEIGEKGDDDVSVPRTTPRSEDLSNAATPISPLPDAGETEKFNDVNIEKQETDASNPNPKPAAAAAALDAGKERREDDNHSSGKENVRWRPAMEGDPVMQLMGMPQTFSYNQLSDSTGGFSKESKLGDGGFGSVYRGMLPRYNVPVAVKKINGASAQGEKEFMAEVSIISQLRHRNLIQLLGYCKEEDKFLLVYELMPNGSLDKALFGRPGEDAARLSWEQRFEIVTGTAAALDYLHQGLKQQVIHRDIKASNIMLDEDWSVKLGDFGLARLVDRRRKAAATMVAGTPGYIAPEVFTSGRFTDKTDVFAFGVVALEVACGRQAWAPRAPLQEAVLVNWVWDSVSTGDVLSTVDELLEDYDAYWMKVLLTIGLLCTHPDPLARPSMRRVVQVLAGDVPAPSLPDSKPGPALLQAAECSSIDESERPCSASASASGSQLLDLEITFAQMTGRPPAHSL